MLAVPSKNGSSHSDVLKNGPGAAQGQVTRGNLNGLAVTHFASVRRVPNGQTQPLEAAIVTGPKNANRALALLGRLRQRQSPRDASHERHRKMLLPKTAADARNAPP